MKNKLTAGLTEMQKKYFRHQLRVHEAKIDKHCPFCREYRKLIEKENEVKGVNI